MHSDELNPIEQEKETAKWWWLGAILLLIVFIAILAFSGPARPRYSYVRARHILMKANTQDPAEATRIVERLRELRQRILNGEDFAKLAREYSEDEYSAPRGGDLGISKKGQYSGTIEDYLWEGPVGQVSDVIRSPHGYHLILIEERRLNKVEEYLKEQEKILKERKLDDTLEAHAQQTQTQTEGTSTSSNNISADSE